jgi:hypothetical protein
VAVVGAVLAGIVAVPAILGVWAASALKIQEFLATQAGLDLLAALRPLWEMIKKILGM